MHTAIPRKRMFSYFLRSFLQIIVLVAISTSIYSLAVV